MRFEIIDDRGRVRDYSESAVVPWRPEKLQAGPALAVDGRYFDYRDGDRTAKAGFLVGANWQDRVQYCFTWHNPNGLRVAGDALKMAAAGMRIVRTHYMLPGWMRTVPWQIYAAAVPGIYDQFELGPELSERHARALEAHIMIFNSLGILFQPTVFTLPPPQMGSPSSWGGNARLAACPGLMENQERFSRQMIERFGRVPGVVWDLVNEASQDMTRFGEWLAVMKPIWGRNGQLVGIGGGSGILSNVQLGEAADWHALHRSPVFHNEGFHTGKPHLLQEAWIDTETTFAGETDLGRLTSLGVAITLHDHGAGYMPWNWNQFYTNWRYGTKFVELWDNDLGACVHADLTPRRGGVMLRNWAVLLDGVSFDQQAERQVVFVYPKTFYAGEGTAEYLDALYSHRVPFRAVNDADLAARRSRRREARHPSLHGPRLSGIDLEAAAGVRRKGRGGGGPQRFAHPRRGRTVGRGPRGPHAAGTRAARPRVVRLDDGMERGFQRPDPRAAGAAVRRARAETVQARCASAPRRRNAVPREAAKGGQTL